MKILILCMLSLFIIQANEAEELLEESCVKCHNNSVYQKPKRKITSLKSLKSRVTACNTNLGAGWFPDEEKQVADYLNEKHYHF